jgi:hypothetical protein
VKCWICTRAARGFGIIDTHHGIGDARRYPIDWVFCSRRCQDAFHALYIVRVEAERLDREPPMIDATQSEQAAIRSCLKAFGEAAGEIGFTKPLGDYSEAQALQVIEAIVTGYTQAMVAHHEATKFPPVRGLPHTPDPMAVNSANPFSDMEDDLPWEKS